MTERDENDLSVVDEKEEGKDGKEGKEGKGGKTESGGLSRGEASVSPGFFEYMAQVGASKHLIAEVLRNWRHYKGEGLLRRVMEFAKGLIKSSHVQVEIERGKDYGVVHNFIQSTKADKAPAHTHHHDHRHDRRNTPGPQ